MEPTPSNLQASLPARTNPGPSARLGGMGQTLKRDLFLYLLVLPGVLYFLVFKYVPMWGC
ncbi:hypothetical protein LJK88_46360 [Paenibacillus sp. P26]|nr:hypothetical protein LJK88_46360 [Paenibacillus sp. P26]UUZ91984.1 hypothetical protein LJK87_41975 [Paenibacillus sp. P25]